MMKNLYKKTRIYLQFYCKKLKGEVTVYRFIILSIKIAEADVTFNEDI
jgi:hypothetical protein